MDIFSVFTLCGGLAFFLYGMTVMSKSLEKMAGGRLEQMLKRDGFTEGELSQLRQRAQAPAAQQLPDANPQPLDIPPASSSDDFVSFYSRKPADGQDTSRP